jgi:hypothetical protein
VTTYFFNAIWKIIWHFFGIFGRNYLEIFWKFSSFLVQTYFKLFFLKSSAKNIWNATFYCFQICLGFVSSLLFIFWIIIFWMKLRFGRNPSKLSSIKNYKKMYSTETCQIEELSWPPHIYFMHLMKKNISVDVLEFRFFSIFFKIWNFQFWRRNRVKTN